MMMVDTAEEMDWIFNKFPFLFAISRLWYFGNGEAAQRIEVHDTPSDLLDRPVPDDEFIQHWAYVVCDTTRFMHRLDECKVEKPCTIGDLIKANIQGCAIDGTDQVANIVVVDYKHSDSFAGAHVIVYRPPGGEVYAP